MLDCHEVMRRLWAYVDGELPADENQAVAEHLSMCARCNPQHRFELTFLAALVRSHARVPEPRPEFRQRVRAALAAVDPNHWS